MGGFLMIVVNIHLKKTLHILKLPLRNKSENVDSISELILCP